MRERVKGEREWENTCCLILQASQSYLEIFCCCGEEQERFFIQGTRHKPYQNEVDYRDKRNFGTPAERKVKNDRRSYLRMVKSKLCVRTDKPWFQLSSVMGQMLESFGSVISGWNYIWPEFNLAGPILHAWLFYPFKKGFC